MPKNNYRKISKSCIINSNNIAANLNISISFDLEKVSFYSPNFKLNDLGMEMNQVNRGININNNQIKIPKTLVPILSS